MTSTSSRGIRLHLSNHQNSQGLDYQLLSVELTRPDRIIYPEELANLELPPGINTTGGVVVSGRAPTWLYGFLIHELHPTAWVAFYEPRLDAAVVTATHSRVVEVGQVIPLESSDSEQLAPGLLIVGSPGSGKSVLAYALFQALLPINPNVYLQRANWDGEGNYVLAMGEETEAQEHEAYKAKNKDEDEGTPNFFPYHAQAILQLRRQKSLVIVDLGGMVQPEKQPILEACSHYLIIDAQPEMVAPWHEFCRDRGNLSPIAVIHSTLEVDERIHQRDPYLEMTCGAWIQGQSYPIPLLLLERVQQLIKPR